MNRAMTVEETKLLKNEDFIIMLFCRTGRLSHEYSETDTI
jgi:hypothetical protein